MTWKACTLVDRNVYRSTCVADPNRPGEIKILLKSNHSLFFQWDDAESMTAGSFNYSLTYWPSYNTSLYLTSNNTFILDGLRSGTPYNVSVATVGPMGFQSDSIRVYVTTSKFCTFKIIEPISYIEIIFQDIHILWLKYFFRN